MLNVMDIVYTSRTVWVGIAAVLMGLAQTVAMTVYDVELPFDTRPELLILGGLAAIYSKGGKQDVDVTSKSSN